MRCVCVILKRDHSGGGETSRVCEERSELRVWMGKQVGACTFADRFRFRSLTTTVAPVGTGIVRIGITRPLGQ